MRNLLLLILLTASAFTNAQDRYFNNKDIYEIKVTLSLGKSEAELSSVQSIRDANQSFVNEVDTARSVNIFIKNNKEYISNLFLSMNRSSNEIGYIDSSCIPDVFKYNTSKVVIFDSFVYLSVLNNRMMSKNKQIKHIVENVANSLFLKIADIIDNRISYIGLSIAYCDKNFGNEYEKKKGNAVLVIAPIPAIKSFGGGQITEREFCRKCDYYLSDRDCFMCIKRIDSESFE